MKKTGKVLAVIVGAVLLVVLGAMVGPRAAHAFVAALVEVVNTPAQPVPVKDVQSPFGTPFFAEVACPFLGADQCVQPLLDAPAAGQVAKIEYVSVLCQLLTPGNDLDYVDIQTPYGTGDNLINVPPATAHIGIFGLPAFGQTVSIYAMPGNAVRVIIQATQGESGRCFVSVNGFLVSQ